MKSSEILHFMLIRIFNPYDREEYTKTCVKFLQDFSRKYLEGIVLTSFVIIFDRASNS